MYIRNIANIPTSKGGHSYSFGITLDYKELPITFITSGTGMGILSVFPKILARLATTGSVANARLLLKRNKNSVLKQPSCQLSTKIKLKKKKHISEIKDSPNYTTQ